MKILLTGAAGQLGRHDLVQNACFGRNIEKRVRKFTLRNLFAFAVHHIDHCHGHPRSK